jgi:hypothetical protein
MCVVSAPCCWWTCTSTYRMPLGSYVQVGGRADVTLRLFWTHQTCITSLLATTLKLLHGVCTRAAGGLAPANTYRLLLATRQQTRPLLEFVSCDANSRWSRFIPLAAW